jgi:hypothetical protein
MRHAAIIAFCLLALAAPALAVEPDDSGTINIMKPEPGTPATKREHARKARTHREAAPARGYGAKQDSRRGSSSPVYPTPLPGPQAPLPTPHLGVVAPAPKAPPPLYVPQTGRTLPNLPATGSGPGGRETFQDRSARCAHQAGVYGSNATGNPGAYIGSCVNQ